MILPLSEETFHKINKHTNLSSFFKAYIALYDITYDDGIYSLHCNEEHSLLSFSFLKRILPECDNFIPKMILKQEVSLLGKITHDVNLIFPLKRMPISLSSPRLMYSQTQMRIWHDDLLSYLDKHYNGKYEIFYHPALKKDCVFYLKIDINDDDLQCLKEGMLMNKLSNNESSIYKIFDDSISNDIKIHEYYENMENIIY